LAGTRNTRTLSRSAVVARSRGAIAYHWQALRPRAATATGDQRINSFGIGGEVEVRTGLHVQRQTIKAPYVHFGLGEAKRYSSLTVTWPSGRVEELGPGASGRRITVRDGRAAEASDEPVGIAG